MSFSPDPYDTGIPKYQTAGSIYEGLCTAAQGEEIGILSEIFADVSYEGQDYYYTDKAGDLKERFEAASEYENKMWVMELAIFQLDENAEIHDIVYASLCDGDMAKRLNFKPLFIEHMLRGDKTAFDDVSEAFLCEAQELNRFDYWAMTGAFERAMAQCEKPVAPNPYQNPYNSFCGALSTKAKGLRLGEETRLIAECRAFLYSYDDFILGMRMNQRLYEEQEQRYNAKVAALEADYAKKVESLQLIAEQNGISLESFPTDLFLGKPDDNI